MISFILADLIVLPILNIYRKYYGARMSLFLLATFYLPMAAAGLLVDLLFEALGLVPAERTAKVVEASITLNYTSVLNVLFLLLAGVLVVRFLRTGGPAMLRMMDPRMAGTRCGLSRHWFSRHWGTPPPPPGRAVGTGR